MISVSEADKIISKNIKAFPAEDVILQDAYGAVLQEDIVADRDLPPFTKSLMDGIAIHFSVWQKGDREFAIEGIQPPGQQSTQLHTPGSCIKIMTGAMVPEGADCIIPVEHVKEEKGVASVSEEVEVKKMQFVHQQGADHSQGELLVEKGTVLEPPQIAVAASVGKARLNVSIRPKVAVISTGDELVDIDADAEPFQIRKSNTYFVDAALSKTRLFEVTVFHFKDDKKILLEEIWAILKDFDVLIISGGVSMGEHDYIPEVLTQLGVDILLHKVAQRPGKPFYSEKALMTRLFLVFRAIRSRRKWARTVTSFLT